jgi:hypothetical protein
MGFGMFRIQGGIELVLVGGEPLGEVQFIGVDENGKPCTFGFGADEL